MAWIELAAPARSAQEALLAVASGARPFLLEGSGAVAGDGLGRYSYAGCEPRDRFVARDPERAWADFSRWLRAHAGPASAPAIVGFATYEAGRRALDARLPVLPDRLGLPLLDWAYYDALVRRDEATGACSVVAVDRAAADRLLARLAAPPGRVVAPLPELRFAAEWSDADYCAKVVKILDYLRAGDAYQVNLTQQLRAPLATRDALAAYLAVRRSFAAPLGGYLELEDAALLGNSPELLLRRRGTRVESRPIKGTAPRGADPSADAAQIAALRASAKDAAEHIMIVDLVRHDLGSLATIGSVHVDPADLMRVLTLPTVHHLVSTVAAEVEPAIDPARLLAALLPGGSVTGAPKRRAVQIIDELEGRSRGVYCGAFGWIAPNGDCDLALPIRTAVATRGDLVLGVGGGIVVDSSPEAELAECHLKAAAFVRALAG